jgi:hypothetical protein
MPTSGKNGLTQPQHTPDEAVSKHSPFITFVLTLVAGVELFEPVKATFPAIKTDWTATQWVKQQQNVPGPQAF